MLSSLSLEYEPTAYSYYKGLVAVGCVGPDLEHPLESSSILYKPPHVNNYTHLGVNPLIGCWPGKQ